jgi:phosphoglycolate phosphatase
MPAVTRARCRERRRGFRPAQPAPLSSFPAVCFFDAVLSLVIFDCDGVLFDSAPANVAYYNAVLERMGRPGLNEEWGRRAHFLSSFQLYDAMFGAESELAEAARRAASDVDYSPFFRLMRPMPDLERVLTLLKRHYRLAMATNRGGTVSGVVHRFGLDNFIELTVGALDVPRPKPHPDMIEKCLEHFRVQPPAAVYVGDSETDHQAALAAGVHFIGVGGATPAEHRVPDLRELPALLERLAG